MQPSDFRARSQSLQDQYPSPQWLVTPVLSPSTRPVSLLSFSTHLIHPHFVSLPLYHKIWEQTSSKHIHPIPTLPCLVLGGPPPGSPDGEQSALTQTLWSLWVITKCKLKCALFLSEFIRQFLKYQSILINGKSINDVVDHWRGLYVGGRFQRSDLATGEKAVDTVHRLGSCLSSFWESALKKIILISTGACARKTITSSIVAKN